MKHHPSKSAITSPSMGFSYVEVLVAMIIASITFLLITRFSISNARRLGVEGAKSRIEERVQVAMTRFRYDVRYLAYDPNGVGSGSPYISTALTDSFAFLGDIDGDNALETVTYRKNGNVFERAVSDQNGGAYLPVATNLQTISFTYYDVNDNVTATLADIRKVEVQATFQTEGMDMTTNPSKFNILTVTESFVPRNLLL